MRKYFGIKSINEMVLKELKWLFSELYCLNKLALVGVSSLVSDALQVKMGTIFISRTSGTDISEEVSALYLGQTIIGITAYVVMQGITTGMNTLCSQAYGAGSHGLVGTYFMRALVIASLTCFPLWSLWISVTPILYCITGDMMLAEGAGHYTSMFCYAYPGYIFWKLSSGFLQSQNIVYSILPMMLVSNVFNIGLQYLLVVVFPLGITGVALSYVISTNAVALFAFIYIRMTDVHITNFSGWSITYLSGWYHFLRYGMACVLEFSMSVIIFRIIPIVFIGFILRETEQFALVAILNTIWHLPMSVSIGFAIGATVRVGNLLGENNILLAKKVAVIAIVYSIFCQLSLGIVVFSLSHPLSYIFKAPEEMREKIEFGIKILSICIISDIINTVRGIMNACCLQFYSTLIHFVCNILIASPLGVLLAYYVPWRAAGYYLMPSVGMLVCVLIEISILCCYNWKYIAGKVLQNVSSQKEDMTDPLLTNSDNLIAPVHPISQATKTFLVLRYMILILTGVGVFVFVNCY